MARTQTFRTNLLDEDGNVVAVREWEEDVSLRAAARDVPWAALISLACGIQALVCAALVLLQAAS